MFIQNVRENIIWTVTRKKSIVYSAVARAGARGARAPHSFFSSKVKTDLYLEMFETITFVLLLIF